MAAGLLIALVVCAGEAEPYAWPLDLPRQITSSFAEYRSGRFHAGIDLRTGPVGKPVYAAADGEVVRLRCSPYGYGKAIYIRLDDGHTAIYAHLDAFEEPFAAFVRQAQHARRNYTVDLHPSAGTFRVSRGQRIAYSGDTGVGVPHLHYEIRDRNNEAINPKLLGIDWPDTTRPIIHRVLIVPQSPRSLVNGDVLPVVLEARPAGAGQYTTDPIDVYGGIGVGVDVVDPANEGANRLGIRVLRTEIDGRELFRLQHDYISYDTNAGGAVAYHPFFMDRGRFLLAWRWPGNETRSYRVTSADGWIDTPLTPTELRVQCIDFHDNDATVTIPLRPAHPELTTVAMVDASGEGQGTVDLDCTGPWLVVTARFTDTELVVPELDIAGGLASGGQFVRVDNRTFRAGIEPSRTTESIRIRVEHPRMPSYEQTVHVFHRGDRDRTVSWDTVRLDVPATAPFGVLYAMAETAADGPSAPPIPGRGPAYTIWPAPSPLDSGVRISVPIPERFDELSRLSLYRWSGRSWSRIATEHNNGRLSAETSRLGTFRVLEDNVPPYLHVETPANNAVLTSRRPPIRGRVSDTGSGIASLTVTLNDTWLLTAYDPEEDAFVWEQDMDLPSGTHRLRVDAVDHAGNLTRSDRTITLP